MSASEFRFWPKLGDHIDLQMAPAAILSQIIQIGKKYRIRKIIIFLFLKNPNFSARAQYNINQGADFYLFLNYLVGADGRTDEIALS